MPTFQKNLQRFFVYFFTSLSLFVVVLGIQRAKHSNSLGLTTAPDDASKKNGVSSQSALAKIAGVSETISSKGKTYQTPWGDLATTIKVKDGKVIAVEIPTLPDSPPSIYAKPYLIDQALRSGSASIQGVSGATITSRAFKASLESALLDAESHGIAIVSKNLKNNTTAGEIPSLPNTIATPSTIVQTNNTSVNPPVTNTGVSGTFTGAPYQTPWGNAVAAVTFTNGKITAVTMPQVPNSPPSIQAEPYLVQQALAAGSANIQGVSGATYVSIAFKSSLENAISQASTRGTIATPTPNTTSVSSTQTAKPSISRKYRHHDDDDDEWDD